MAAHTPGPWHFEPDRFDRIYGGEVIKAGEPGIQAFPVAVVCDFNRYDRDDERTANARLIAAAPDLLAALRALLAVDDEPCRFDHHGYCQAHHVSAPCIVGQARAAVAKAAGQEGTSG
ncbi:MAG TPA: hypothetical protein VG370_34840 [Chloroflexota bacterium]|jgi:hypothetical protein|nr:hypothetical protein [Chloroflexota bacterium]